MKMRSILLVIILAATFSPAQMNINGRIEAVYINSQNGDPLTSLQNIINQGNPTFLWRFRGYLDMPVSERSSIFTDFRLQPSGLELDFAAVRLLLNQEGTVYDLCRKAGFEPGAL